MDCRKSSLGAARHFPANYRQYKLASEFSKPCLKSGTNSSKTGYSCGPNADFMISFCILLLDNFCGPLGLRSFCRVGFAQGAPCHQHRLAWFFQCQNALRKTHSRCRRFSFELLLSVPGHFCVTYGNCRLSLLPNYAVWGWINRNNNVVANESTSK